MRASVASWFGRARRANAPALALFARRDVRNLGKRMLARELTAP